MFWVYMVTSTNFLKTYIFKLSYGQTTPINMYVCVSLIYDTKFRVNNQAKI